MRLFLDEAGNTGGILDKNEKLNYGTQRHFCLAAVVIDDSQGEQLLRQKYAAFKSRFATEKELKGNSLFAKENNDALEYFLDQYSKQRSFFLYVCTIKNFIWHRFCYLPFWENKQEKKTR